MKKIISIISFLMLIFLSTNVMASTLTLNVTSNKEKVDKNDEVIITVDWKEGMQAADFLLQYDNKKFEFVSSDLDDNFYNVENSRINIVWVSLDDSYKNSINFTFKALKSGKAEFKTEIDGGFSNGELDTNTGYLVIPDEYITGNTTVTVNGLENIYILPIIVVVLIIIIVIILKKFKRK